MNALRKYRLKAKLTIEDLVKASKVTYSTISQLERGLQNARPLTIMRLADALGVEYEDLAELETQAAPKTKAVLAA